MIYLIGQNFVAQNFRRTKFFVGQNFRRLDKFSSLMSDETFCPIKILSVFRTLYTAGKREMTHEFGSLPLKSGGGGGGGDL